MGYYANAALERSYQERSCCGYPSREETLTYYLEDLQAMLSRRGHIGRRAVRYLEKRTKSLLLLLRDKRRTASGVGDPAQRVQHHAVERVTPPNQHIRKSRRNYEYLR